MISDNQIYIFSLQSLAASRAAIPLSTVIIKFTSSSLMISAFNPYPSLKRFRDSYNIIKTYIIEKILP